MRTLIATLIVLVGFACIAAKAGTINLPAQPYCATTQTGDVYNGVTVGSCVVVPPIGTVPPGRVTRANVRYPNVPPSNAARPNVDVTQWKNVFGFASTIGTTPEAWPGARGSSPAFGPFTAYTYVALEFTPAVPAQVAIGISTYNGATLDWTYSTSPGYFNPTASACSGTQTLGNSFTKVSSDPRKAGCPVAIGQRYFLNIRAHQPPSGQPLVQFNLSY